MKTTLLYSIAALALLATACTADDNTGATPSGTDARPVPVSLDVAVETGSATTRATTTAPLTTDGAVVKLSLVSDGTAGSYASLYNVPYSYTSGQWTAANPLVVDARQAARITAYHDPNSKTGFGTSTKTPLSTRDYADTELWYYDTNAHAGISSANAALSILLKCPWTRLTLKITRAANYLTLCKVSKVKIASADGSLITTANLDIADGTLKDVSAHEHTKTVSGALATTGIAAGATDSSVDLLLPPQALTAGMVVTLTVDGTDLATTIAAAKFPGSALKSATRYSLYLTVEGAEVTGGTVTTEDWAVINLGTEYVPLP